MERKKQSVELGSGEMEEGDLTPWGLRLGRLMTEEGAQAGGLKEGAVRLMSDSW